MAIKSYKVIRKSTISSLEDEVDHFLRRGWAISGSMSCQTIVSYVYKDKDEEFQFVTNEMYLQPMTHEVL